MTALDRFAALWVLDCEYSTNGNYLPEPHVFVARELRSNRKIELSGSDLIRGRPPIDWGPDSLCIGYYLLAEFSCFQVLGWPLPAFALDLFAEFRVMRNGQPENGRGLLDAARFFSLASMSEATKDELRTLAMRGEPFTDEERRSLVAYCSEDVELTSRVFEAMAPQIDFPRAIGIRSRFLKALSFVERRGIPIDMPLFKDLSANWNRIKLELADEVNAEFGVFEAGSFRASRFEAYLTRSGLLPYWPRTESGRLELGDKTFRNLSARFPQLEPLRHARHALAQLRLNDLTVGDDGRNRFMASPFGARSGRSTPSNSKSIFGASSWLRSLIRPGPSQAIASLDWSAEEFAIAARLSGDKRMLAAYESGDPYMATAKLAGAVPLDATKITHGRERGIFKVLTLARNYGAGERSLAESLGCTRLEARSLIQVYSSTYHTFHDWIDKIVDRALLTGRIATAYGWPMHTRESNERSLRNWPMQSAGAELMWLAVIHAVEAGVKVIATIHDALVIESEIGTIDDDIRKTRDAMNQASRLVLDGFELRSDVSVWRHPDRYRDERGGEFFDRVMGILNGRSTATKAAA